MSPPAPRGVVFDLDGTLVDSYSAIAASLNHARAAFALPALDEAVVRRAVGRGLESLVAEWVGPRRVEDGVRLFRERYAEIYTAGTSALPGAGALLRTLRAARLRLALASNKPARFSRGILQALGWEESFACVAGPDVVGSTKPDPAMIEHCLHSLRLTAAEVVYVGDMLLDVETADRAGVKLVLVEGGSASRAELRASGRPVIPSLRELAPRLGLAGGGGFRSG